MTLLFSIIEFEMIRFLLNQSYQQINPYLFLVNVFIVISVFITFIAFFLIYVNKNIKMEKDMVEDHLKIFEELYSELLKQDREVSKTNHNIRHEREYLLQLLSQKNISEAIKYIESKFETYKEETIWTGFKCIDFIINRRKKIIDDNEIDFQINTSLVHIPISDSEFTILFGNLMDNALEAVVKCQKGNRKIVLEIKNAGNIFRLMLSNSSNNSKTMKNIQLYTTKTNNIIHGWGLKSVEAIVEKYHGDIKYDLNKNKFQVRIIFWN